MNTFKTDAGSIPGTEYLAVTWILDQWLEKSLPKDTNAEMGLKEKLQELMSCFIVKGWSPCVCALGTLRVAYEVEECNEAQVVSVTLVMSASCAKAPTFLQAL